MQEFQNQQLEFMSKLKGSGRSTSPTQSIQAPKESPRILSFRSKFPSASKYGVDPEGASPDVKRAISPIALEEKLNQSATIDLNHNHQLVDRSVDQSTDSHISVPSQAASIAKMWLEQARYAIQYYQGWEATWASWTPEQQQEYYSQYYEEQGYDLNHNQ